LSTTKTGIEALPVVAGPVVHDEDRHRGAVDAGERADALVVVAAVDLEVA
jgi:hypothetical protein